MKAVLSLVALLMVCTVAKAETYSGTVVAMPVQAMPAQPMMARPVTVVQQTTVAVPRPCGIYSTCGIPVPPPCGGGSHCGAAAPYYGGGYGYGARPYYGGKCGRGCCKKQRCGKPRCCGGYGRPAAVAAKSNYGFVGVGPVQVGWGSSSGGYVY